MSNEMEVLLVEDNPHDLELTLRALRKHRFANEVTAVRDGASAGPTSVWVTVDLRPG